MRPLKCCRDERARMPLAHSKGAERVGPQQLRPQPLQVVCDRPTVRVRAAAPAVAQPSTDARVVLGEAEAEMLDIGRVCRAGRIGEVSQVEAGARRVLDVDEEQVEVASVCGCRPEHGRHVLRCLRAGEHHDGCFLRRELSARRTGEALMRMRRIDVDPVVTDHWPSPHGQEPRAAAQHREHEQQRNDHAISAAGDAPCAALDACRRRPR